MTPHRRNLRGPDGKTYALELGGYDDHEAGGVEEWLFGPAPPGVKAGLARFRTPRFERTLSEGINAVIAAGLRLDRLAEPRADDETVARCPDMQHTQVMPCFLHVRCTKD